MTPTAEEIAKSLFQQMMGGVQNLAPEQSEAKSEESEPKDEKTDTDTAKEDAEQKAEELKAQEQRQEQERIMEKQVDELKIYKSCLEHGIVDKSIVENITAMMNGDPEGVIKFIAEVQNARNKQLEDAGKVVEEKEKKDSTQSKPNEIEYV